MRRRLLWTSIFMILLVALAIPIANAFDHWDKSPGLSNDTELQANAIGIACVMCATIGLACAGLANFKPKVLFHFIIRPRITLPDAPVMRVPADASPPLPLQLRI